MASSITLDVSGLTQQLVAAVTAGMAKVQQEMSKQEMSKSGANSNALDKTGIINLVGIRAQIVDNARVIYSAKFEVDLDLVLVLTVVVKSEGESFSAVVLYPAKHAPYYRWKQDRLRMAVLFRSIDSETAENALENLLCLTSCTLGNS